LNVNELDGTSRVNPFKIVGASFTSGATIQGVNAYVDSEAALSDVPDGTYRQVTTREVRGDGI
jgi:hypothetical protein